MMRIFSKRLAAAAAFAASVCGITPAFAAGADTNAGTAISNTASIAYSVNSVTGFTASSNTDVINVDRKVQLSVVEKATVGTTSVTPGQTGQATIFDITNTTNGALDIRIAAANLTSGSQANVHGGSVTDAFDVTNFVYYVENGLSPGLQTSGASADTLLVASGGVFYLDEVAEDAVKTVYVLADTPTTATNGQIAAISLTGTASLPGTASTMGAVLADDSGTANTSAVQNVFNDAAGTETGDIVKDGKHSARDDYTVSAPVLAVSKISWVVSDPVSGTTNPKMIPGAVVGYCITVSNTGPTAADSVSITDNLSTLPVTYTASSAQVIAAGPSGGTCSGSGAGGAFASSTVTGTLGTVPATTGVKSVWFTVTIN
jgi:uncharacterized repeat protein (TIGR01451 family)